MEDGKLLTENPIILQWVADQVPAKQLAPANGTMERYRFQEWLNFICSELHKTVFSPQFNPRASDEWKQVLRGVMEARFAVVENHLKDRQYMSGDGFTLADSYLFTIVRWTGPMKIDLSPWPALKAHHARIAERPHVKAAMQTEGLI
jgi:glutathione S-transferase